jgi:hypothetical protein
MVSGNSVSAMQGSCAHYVVAMAQILRQGVLSALAKYQAAWPTYRVVVSGHSLVRTYERPQGAACLRQLLT